MGTLNYTITKKVKHLAVADSRGPGVHVVASRCIGKAPARGGFSFNPHYRDNSEKIWNTRITKSVNAAKFHSQKPEGLRPTYIVKGDFEDGAEIADWTPNADFMDDYYWDGKSVGWIRKVNGRFVVVFDNSEVRHRVWDRAQNGFNPKVRHGDAELSYNYADDEWRMTNLRNGSQHTLPGDSEYDRVNAHWKGFHENVNKAV